MSNGSLATGNIAGNANNPRHSNALLLNATALQAQRSWHSLQTCFRDRLPAIDAFPIGSIFNALQCVLNLGQQSLLVDQDGLLLLHLYKVNSDILKSLWSFAGLDRPNRLRMGLRQVRNTLS